MRPSSLVSDEDRTLSRLRGLPSDHPCFFKGIKRTASAVAMTRIVRVAQSKCRLTARNLSSRRWRPMRRN